MKKPLIYLLSTLSSIFFATVCPHKAEANEDQNSTIRDFKDAGHKTVDFIKPPFFLTGICKIPHDEATLRFREFEKKTKIRAPINFSEFDKKIKFNGENSGFRPDLWGKEFDLYPILSKEKQIGLQILKKIKFLLRQKLDEDALIIEAALNCARAEIKTESSEICQLYRSEFLPSLKKRYLLMRFAMAINKDRNRHSLSSVSLEHDISFVEELFPESFWSGVPKSMAPLSLKEVAEAYQFLNLPENRNLKKRILTEPERFYQETLAYTPILRFFKEDHIDSKSAVFAYEELKKRKPDLPLYMKSGSLPQSLIYNVPEAYQAILKLPPEDQIIGCEVADVMLSNAHFMNKEAPILFDIALIFLSMGQSLEAQLGESFIAHSGILYKKWLSDWLVKFYPMTALAGYSLEGASVLGEVLEKEDPMCRQYGVSELVNFNVESWCQLSVLSSSKSEFFITGAAGVGFLVARPILDLTLRGFVGLRRFIYKIPRM